jgi:SAM-dependent methyltransferase
MVGWTRAHLRHFTLMLRHGRHPARIVYESLGDEFFMALAPGWLNLGLWEGCGDAVEAPAAPRRLVEALCEPLPEGGVILDVGNGLGVQDLVVADRLRPRLLVTLNLSEFQLRAGRRVLAEAGALPVVADAVRLPIAARAVDGVLSVEAAFHFSSRAAFFAEARRVLRPGGVLSLSDILTPRLPRDPIEFVAGVTSLRFWGLRPAVVAGPAEIEELARAAGFTDVVVRPCGDAVFDPLLRFERERLRTLRGVPCSQRLAAGLMISQWELLRRREMLEYVLVQAVAR